MPIKSSVPFKSSEPLKTITQIDTKTKVGLGVGVVACVGLLAFFINMMAAGILPIITPAYSVNIYVNGSLSDSTHAPSFAMGQSLTFVATVTNPSQPPANVQYFWFFDNAGFIGGSSTTTKYATPGTKLVALALVSNGQVIARTSGAISITPPYCTDSDTNSDSTDNNFLKGDTVGMAAGGQMTKGTDYCSDVNTWPNSSPSSSGSGKYLVEYYCQNGVVNQVIVGCDNGCKDGSCVSIVNITLMKNQAYGNQTVTSPAYQAKVGSFLIAASSSEGINVNNILISNATSGVFSNMKLKVGSTIIGSKAIFPAINTSTAISVNGKLNLATSETKVVDIYADIANGLNSQNVQLSVNADGTTANSNLIAKGTDQALQTITIGNGSLAIDPNGAKPDPVILVAGGSLSVPVGAFTMMAANDSFTITNLTIASAYYGTNSDRSIGAVILAYQNEAKNNLTATGYLMGGKAIFNNLSIWVPKGVGATVTIKALIADATGAQSGDLVRLNLAPSNGTAATFTAISKAAGSAIYTYAGSASTGNTMVVRMTKPVVASVSLPSSILADGTQTIGKFSIFAQSEGDISWRRLNLKYTASTGVALSDCFLTSSGSNIATSVQIGQSDISIDLPTPQLISQNSNKTYEFRCVINGVGPSSYLTTKIDGSIAAVGTTGTYINLVNAGENRFIWSDLSSSTHSTSSNDWCDSNYIAGLPTVPQALVN